VRSVSGKECSPKYALVKGRASTKEKVNKYEHWDFTWLLTLGMHSP